MATQSNRFLDALELAMDLTLENCTEHSSIQGSVCGSTSLGFEFSCEPSIVDSILAEQIASATMLDRFALITARYFYRGCTNSLSQYLDNDYDLTFSFSVEGSDVDCECAEDQFSTLITHWPLNDEYPQLNRLVRFLSVDPVLSHDDFIRRQYRLIRQSVESYYASRIEKIIRCYDTLKSVWPTDPMFYKRTIGNVTVTFEQSKDWPWIDYRDPCIDPEDIASWFLHLSDRNSLQYYVGEVFLKVQNDGEEKVVAWYTTEIEQEGDSFRPDEHFRDLVGDLIADYRHSLVANQAA
ncbi:hypothetical protein [uncultured Umboniibacter sp.]|uniref:hypothetical protein n=1 Tax=uncultured Umboniibacter sp. TaxID=1798917 RepID=UPI00261FD0B1|nr:hypothetical protein [uncultured Umboniibacter sp.]